MSYSQSIYHPNSSKHLESAITTFAHSPNTPDFTSNDQQVLYMNQYATVDRLTCLLSCIEKDYLNCVLSDDVTRIDEERFSLLLARLTTILNDHILQVVIQLLEDLQDTIYALIRLRSSFFSFFLRNGPSWFFQNLRTYQGRFNEIDVLSKNILNKNVSKLKGLEENIATFLGSTQELCEGAITRDSVEEPHELLANLHNLCRHNSDYFNQLTGGCSKSSTHLPFEKTSKALRRMTSTFHLKVSPAFMNHPEGQREENKEVSVQAVIKSLNEVLTSLPKFNNYIQKKIRKRKVSHFSRNWLFYSLGTLSCLAILPKVKALYRSGYHLELMERVHMGVTLFVREHITIPYAAIYNEVFLSNYQSIGDAVEVAVTNRSLNQMLEDFSHDHGKQDGLSNMDFLMEIYEKQIKHPVRNIFVGEIVRSLLIQVQKLKAEVEEEMLAVDKLMRANELNLQIMATVPALALGVSFLYCLRVFYVWARNKGRGSGIYENEKRAKMHLVHVERWLNALSNIDLTQSTNLSKKHELVGRLVHSVAQLQKETSHISMKSSTRYTLSHDLDTLKRASYSLQDIGLKIRVAERMNRCYAFFMKPLP